MKQFDFTFTLLYIKHQTSKIKHRSATMSTMRCCLFHPTPIKELAFLTKEERIMFYRKELRTFIQMDDELTPEKIIKDRINWADLVEHDEFMDIVRKIVR